jgi:DMSO/TMAO reductase YedYZ molybdopterin-dependent catalytic subunit
MAWGVGGWLVTPTLARIGAEGIARLRARIAAELKTTFASRYTAQIGLAEALQPETIAAYSRMGTGAKYLITPNKGLAG